MFRNFGARKNFKSNAINCGGWSKNISYFGKTDCVHDTRHENLKLVKQILEKKI